MNADGIESTSGIPVEEKAAIASQPRQDPEIANRIEPNISRKNRPLMSGTSENINAFLNYHQPLKGGNIMKRLVALACVLPFAMGSALAQEPERVEPGDPVMGIETPGEETANTAPVKQSQENEELLSSWVLETTVMSPEGEAIGNIEEILINEDVGSISGVVLAVGGFLGFGAKSIAVDWSELSIDYDANEITASITRAEAEAAPEYAFRDRKQRPLPEPAMDATGTGGIGEVPATPAPSTE